MTSVSRKWIGENVEKLSGFGGQVDKEYVLQMKVPKGGFETSLTAKGLEAFEHGDREKMLILLPKGLGWATAYSIR